MPIRPCGVGPPLITSPAADKGSIDGWIYQIAVKDFRISDPGSTLVVNNLPSWATLNPLTLTISGVPPVGEYEMEIVATNSNGSDTQKLFLSVTEVAANSRWGRSVLDMVGESEVLAFAGRTYRSSIAEGSYQFAAGASNMEYLYIWTEDSLGNPGARASGKGWFSGAFQSAMAGVAEGYTAAINGWYYEPLVVGGQPGKLWRTLYPSIAAQNLICII